MAKSPSIGNIPNLIASLKAKKVLGTNTAHLDKPTALNGPGTDHPFFPMTSGGPAKKGS